MLVKRLYKCAFFGLWMSKKVFICLEIRDYVIVWNVKSVRVHDIKTYMKSRIISPFILNLEISDQIYAPAALLKF